MIVGRKFMQSEGAGVAVEFVALVPAFLFLTLFVFEIAIALLWVGTAEKAAQLGARLAVVSSYAVTDLLPTTRNGLAPGTYLYGDGCETGACTAFATKICPGGGSNVDCATANCFGATVPCFTVIVNRMRSIMSLIQDQNVTIKYEYIGLGYAGGPIVPRVSVTIQNVPYDTFTTTILAGFMRLATGNPSATSPLTNLPTITATFTGEDLNTAGAS